MKRNLVFLKICVNYHILSAPKRKTQFDSLLRSAVVSESFHNLFLHFGFSGVGR